MFGFGKKKKTKEQPKDIGALGTSAEGSTGGSTGDAAWPLRLIGRRSKRELYLEFDSGEKGTIEAELLRVLSPSAEVKGHGAGPGILVTGKQNVTIQNLEPVGNYAVRIIFDDGHSTGLYTWDLLLDILRTKPAKWAAYQDRLQTEGGGR